MTNTSDYITGSVQSVSKMFFMHKKQLFDKKFYIYLLLDIFNNNNSKVLFSNKQNKFVLTL